jgi:hypothetical protein
MKERLLMRLNESGEILFVLVINDTTCRINRTPLCFRIVIKLRLSLTFAVDFHIHTVHLDTIKVYHLPTGAHLNCLKNNFKIYIKIDIKTAPTCFGVITIITERIIRSC